MDRFVMRHPDLDNAAVIPASSVAHHKTLGWQVVSDPIPEHDADRVDLSRFPALPADIGPEPDTDQPQTDDVEES